MTGPVLGAEEHEAGVGRDVVQVALVLVDADGERLRVRGVLAGRGEGDGREPLALPPRKSGIASAKMKMKMKRTLRMMKTPPKVITPVAARSTSLTRAIRLVAAAIRSRTPMLAVAMRWSLPRGWYVGRPGRSPLQIPAPGAS